MSAPDPGAPLRILIVDDENDVRGVLCSMLRREGHELREAANGRDALKILGTESFDLVLTDLVMPEMEGLEFIRALLAQAPETRVIAMSGVSAGPTYLQAASRFGVIATLDKPFRREDLLAAIERARQTGD